MALKCKIGIHSWDGCKCTGCDKTRDEQHDWSKDCEKCSKCGKIRDKQHDWSKDCEKCSDCSKTRENKHDWSNDCEKCSICAKIRENHHDWDGCKCSSCEQTRDKQHNLDGCVCTICGTEKHNWQSGSEGCTRCGRVIEISTLSELQSINNNPKAHYCLVADIDATETINWNSGEGFEPIYFFQGRLNGCSHFIKNLYINRPSRGYVGLFSHVFGGTLENIVLTNVKINGKNFVGSLVGISDEKSNIINCNSSGYVEGERFTGGLVGCNSNNSTISECSFTGKVSCVVSKIFLTDNEEAELQNIIKVGVFVISSDNIGGLVGVNYKSTISFCSSSGKIAGGSRIGGLVGTTGVQSSVQNSFSICDVNGGSNVGGFVGSNHDQSTISECSSAGNVVGFSSVGGLVGINEYASNISKCNSCGNVYSDDEAGGLVGRNSDGSVSNCCSSGEVESQRVVGGLVGSNEKTISECYSSGKVIGKDKYKYNYKSKDPYMDWVGGLIGFNGSPFVKQSYWDVQTSCQSPSLEPSWRVDGKGFGKTTKEMKQQETYKNWDFENIWLIEENCYPMLRCLHPDKK